MATIGGKIKALRERHGESQADLGRVLAVSDKAVSSWENEKKMPRMKYVQRIAGHYGVQVSSLMEENVTAKEVVEESEGHTMGVSSSSSVAKTALGVGALAVGGAPMAAAIALILSAAEKIASGMPQNDNREINLVEKYKKLSDRDKLTIDTMIDSFLKISGDEARDAAQDSASSAEGKSEYA